MTDLTLPGTIPGLLRRGSPVQHPRFGRGVALDPADPVTPAIFERYGNALWTQMDLRDEPGLALGLSDVTGRAHAAWWLVGNSNPDDVGNFLVRSGLDVLRFCLVGEKAATGDDLSDEDILLLRRVILYVAGIDGNG